MGYLRTLSERAYDGIPMEDALQALSEMLAAYASQFSWSPFVRG